jgi:nitroreductase
METREAISRRRSIRKFKDAPVPREMIERVLSAAVLALSAKNRQPWRFVVLQ